MSKGISILAVFILAVSPLSAQCDSLGAREIIQRYISVTGGNDALNKVKTLQKTEYLSVGADTVMLVTRLIRGNGLKLVRSSGGYSQTAVVKDKMGVNITSDGIFEMPDDQVRRYTREIEIIPEAIFLSSPYQLNYRGISRLDDTTTVYEVEVTDTLGNMEIRAYNCVSGLLEIVMKQNRQITRYSDYRSIGGLLLPYRQKTGRNVYTVSDIQVNAKIKAKEFYWNTKNELSFVGTWTALKPLKENGQREFTEITLDPDRGGAEGMGVVLEDGEKVSLDMLSQKIVGWSVSDDTLTLQYYHTREQRLYKKLLVVEEKEKGTFTGYFLEVPFPETDDQSTPSPVYTFIREEQ